MKKLTLAIALLLAALAASAQEPKKEAAEDHYSTNKEFRTRVFEVQHRSPRDLYSSLTLLGSGFRGALMNYSIDMRTITVRDFPENIAAVEDALKRLDKPVVAQPEIELRISVLVASKSSLAGNAVPDDLQPVVKQLQSALRYSNYALMTATMHRTSGGERLEGSGYADSALIGIKSAGGEEMPAFYRYALRNVTTALGERPSIDVRNFEFSMQVPVGGKYQSVGFQTPVTVRENEKVVIGTTTMGEKALIVVVTASVAK